MAVPNLTAAQRKRVNELLEAKRRRQEADRKAEEDEAAEQVERQRYEGEVKAYQDAIGRQFIDDRKAARAQAQGMGSGTSIPKDWASLYDAATDCYADILKKNPGLGLSLHNIGLDPLYSEYTATQGRYAQAFSRSEEAAKAQLTRSIRELCLVNPQADYVHHAADFVYYGNSSAWLMLLFHLNDVFVLSKAEQAAIQKRRREDRQQLTKDPAYIRYLIHHKAPPWMQPTQRRKLFKQYSAAVLADKAYPQVVEDDSVLPRTELDEAIPPVSSQVYQTAIKAIIDATYKEFAAEQKGRVTLYSPEKRALKKKRLQEEEEAKNTSVSAREKRVLNAEEEKEEKKEEQDQKIEEKREEQDQKIEEKREEKKEESTTDRLKRINNKSKETQRRKRMEKETTQPKVDAHIDWFHTKQGIPIASLNTPPRQQALWVIQLCRYFESPDELAKVQHRYQQLTAMVQLKLDGRLPLLENDSLIQCERALRYYRLWRHTLPFWLRCVKALILKNRRIDVDALCRLFTIGQNNQFERWFYWEGLVAKAPFPLFDLDGMTGVRAADVAISALRNNIPSIRGWLEEQRSFAVAVGGEPQKPASKRRHIFEQLHEMMESMTNAHYLGTKVIYPQIDQLSFFAYDPASNDTIALIDLRINQARQFENQYIVKRNNEMMSDKKIPLVFFRMPNPAVAVESFRLELQDPQRLDSIQAFQEQMKEWFRYHNQHIDVVNGLIWDVQWGILDPIANDTDSGALWREVQTKMPKGWLAEQVKQYNGTWIRHEENKEDDLEDVDDTAKVFHLTALRNALLNTGTESGSRYTEIWLEWSQFNPVWLKEKRLGDYVASLRAIQVASYLARSFQWAKDMAAREIVEPETQWDVKRNIQFVVASWLAFVHELNVTFAGLVLPYYPDFMVAELSNPDNQAEAEQAAAPPAPDVEPLLAPSDTPVTIWWILTNIESGGRMTRWRKWSDDLALYAKAKDRYWGTSPFFVALGRYIQMYQGWFAWMERNVVDRMLQAMHTEDEEQDLLTEDSFQYFLTLLNACENVLAGLQYSYQSWDLLIVPYEAISLGRGYNSPSALKYVADYESRTLPATPWWSEGGVGDWWNTQFDAALKIVYESKSKPKVPAQCFDFQWAFFYRFDIQPYIWEKRKPSVFIHTQNDGAVYDNDLDEYDEPESVPGGINPEREQEKVERLVGHYYITGLVDVVGTNLVVPMRDMSAVGNAALVHRKYRKIAFDLREGKEESVYEVSDSLFIPVQELRRHRRNWGNPSALGEADQNTDWQKSALVYFSDMNAVIHQLKKDPRIQTFRGVPFLRERWAEDLLLLRDSLQTTVKWLTSPASDVLALREGEDANTENAPRVKSRAWGDLTLARYLPALQEGWNRLLGGEMGDLLEATTDPAKLTVLLEKKEEQPTVTVDPRLAKIAAHLNKLAQQYQAKLATTQGKKAQVELYRLYSSMAYLYQRLPDNQALLEATPMTTEEKEGDTLPLAEWKSEKAEWEDEWNVCLSVLDMLIQMMGGEAGEDEPEPEPEPEEPEEPEEKDPMLGKTSAIAKIRDPTPFRDVLARNHIPAPDDSIAKRSDELVDLAWKKEGGGRDVEQPAKEAEEEDEPTEEDQKFVVGEDDEDEDDDDEDYVPEEEAESEEEEPPPKRKGEMSPVNERQEKRARLAAALSLKRVGRGKPRTTRVGAGEGDHEVFTPPLLWYGDLYITLGLFRESHYVTDITGLVQIYTHLLRQPDGDMNKARLAYEMEVCTVLLRALTEMEAGMMDVVLLVSNPATTPHVLEAIPETAVGYAVAFHEYRRVIREVSIGKAKPAVDAFRASRSYNEAIHLPWNPQWTAPDFEDMNHMIRHVADMTAEEQRAFAVGHVTYQQVSYREVFTLTRQLGTQMGYDAPALIHTRLAQLEDIVDRLNGQEFVPGAFYRIIVSLWNQERQSHAPISPSAPAAE